MRYAILAIATCRALLAAAQGVADAPEVNNPASAQYIAKSPGGGNQVRTSLVKYSMIGHGCRFLRLDCKNHLANPTFIRISKQRLQSKATQTAQVPGSPSTSTGHPIPVEDPSVSL